MTRAGLDVALDSAESALTGGFLGQARMYAGAYGHGAMEQEEKGGDVYQQNLAGLTRAANAYISTKLLGAAGTAYGKSAASKGLDKAVQAAAAKFPVLQSAAAQRTIKAITNTEGVEEGLEDVLNFVGDKLLGLDKDATLDWNEVKQSALVGWLLGTVTSGVEYSPAEFDQMVTDEIQQLANDTEQSQQAAPERSRFDQTMDALGLNQGQNAESAPEGGNTPTEAQGTVKQENEALSIGKNGRDEVLDRPFYERVAEKLRRAMPWERKAVIRDMPFGEQVAAVENGQITREEKPFVDVSRTTPQVLIDEAGAQQLPRDYELREHISFCKRRRRSERALS